MDTKQMGKSFEQWIGGEYPVDDFLEAAIERTNNPIKFIREFN